MVSDVGTEHSPPLVTEESASLEAIPASEEQFLHLSLDIEFPILLPVRHLIEIITLPIGQVVPMFQMPAWVVGVYNWRGEVLWVIDLNHFLGLTPWYQHQGYAARHTVVILKSSGVEDESSSGREVVLGCVVDRIETMLTCRSDEMKSFTDASFELPSTVTPFVQRYWHDKTQPIHLVLEAAAILNAMPKA